MCALRLSATCAGVMPPLIEFIGGDTVQKFLSALIVVLTVALINVQSVSAADVPSFSAIDSKNIKLAFAEHDLNYKAYSYDCNNMSEDFIKNFTAQLVNGGSFKVTAQFVRKVNRKTFDVVQLKYIGAKKISSFRGIGTADKCDVQICRILPSDKDIVLLYISHGLTYAEGDPERKQPAQNPTVANDGTVPDIGQFNKVVRFSSSRQNADKSVKYVFHAQNLSEAVSDALTAKYIRLLTGSYNFVQTGYEEKFSENKHTQAVSKNETWTFRYTGSKSVSPLSGGNHVHMRRISTPQYGDTTFEITVAHGLTFAGKFGAH